MVSSRNSILMEVPARIMPLSGASIKRLMPYAKKRMVGPFIFFDYFPPADFEAGQGLKVSPHPHIGLSTLSYLLEGAVLHHDSLGCKQVLRPGDVNWMTAGRGISHSERVPEELRGKAHRLHLLQFWVALPLEHEDDPASFTHHEKSTIPAFNEQGCEVTLIAGEAFGQKSPVQVHSPLFFMDVKIPERGRFTFDPQNQEIAFFIIKGSVELGDHHVSENEFIILETGSTLSVSASEDCQMIILGGAALPEPRHIYWNFVSSSKEKIDQAKEAWRSGTFPQVPGELDNLLLPAE